LDWLAALQQLRAEGAPGVLVTVINVRGHAPRDAGAKMLVGTDQIWGSVGGGNLEETAVRRARELIMTGSSATEIIESRLNEHVRGDHGRQCCGGEVSLLLEPFLARPAIAIFGVGHVGFELARILSRLEIQLHLVDSRAEQLDQLRLADVTGGTADVTVHRAVLGELVLERLPSGAQVVIMTHDHAEDFALCDAAIRMCLARPGRFSSIGLIGSRAKWARFRRNLAAEGHSAAAISLITSPIGLPELIGKEPAVIAVGVAARLIAGLGRTRPASRPDAAAEIDMSSGSPTGEASGIDLPSGSSATGHTEIDLPSAGLADAGSADPETAPAQSVGPEGIGSR
jgi:xanthine dehydrogenase accessory factor